MRSLSLSLDHDSKCAYSRSLFRPLSASSFFLFFERSSVVCTLSVSLFHSSSFSFLFDYIKFEIIRISVWKYRCSIFIQIYIYSSMHDSVTEIWIYVNWYIIKFDRRIFWKLFENNLPGYFRLSENWTYTRKASFYLLLAPPSLQLWLSWNLLTIARQEHGLQHYSFRGWWGMKPWLICRDRMQLWKCLYVRHCVYTAIWTFFLVLKILFIISTNLIQKSVYFVVNNDKSRSKYLFDKRDWTYSFDERIAPPWKKIPNLNNAISNSIVYNKFKKLKRARLFQKHGIIF